MFLKEKFWIWKDCGMQKASLRVLRWDLGWIEGCPQCPAGHPIRGQDKELLSQHVAGHLEGGQPGAREGGAPPAGAHPSAHGLVLIYLMSAMLLEITYMAAMNLRGGVAWGEGRARRDINMQSIAAFYLTLHLTYIGRKYWIWYNLNLRIWENLIHNLCVNDKHQITAVYMRLFIAWKSKSARALQRFSPWPQNKAFIIY